METLHLNVERVLSVPSKGIPVGLRLLFRDTFTCPICHGIMAPPVIFGKCCRSILRCEACMNEWFSGEDAMTKSCPRCGTERGYAETVHQCGLDEFLTGIRTMVQD